MLWNENNFIIWSLKVVRFTNQVGKSLNVGLWTVGKTNLGGASRVNGHSTYGQQGEQDQTGASEHVN